MHCVIVFKYILLNARKDVKEKINNLMTPNSLQKFGRQKKNQFDKINTPNIVFKNQ